MTKNIGIESLKKTFNCVITQTGMLGSGRLAGRDSNILSGRNNLKGKEKINKEKCLFVIIFSKHELFSSFWKHHCLFKYYS